MNPFIDFIKILNVVQGQITNVFSSKNTQQNLKHSSEYKQKERHYQNTNADAIYNDLEEITSLCSTPQDSEQKADQILYSDTQKSTNCKYFPILALIFWTLSVLISIATTCKFDENYSISSCYLPSIKDMPFINPFFFQLSSIFCCFFWIATYYCLNVFLFQKFATPEYRLQQALLRYNFAIGTIAILSFMSFSLMPSESMVQSMQLIHIEENISINLYVITSFIFNLISFYLLFSLKDKNLNRSHNYGWIVFKMTIFTVSFLLTLTYFVVMGLAIKNKEFLVQNMEVNMNIPTFYLLKGFIAHVQMAIFSINMIYLALFYFDLKYVSLQLWVQPNYDFFVEKKLWNNAS